MYYYIKPFDSVILKIYIGSSFHFKIYWNAKNVNLVIAQITQRVSRFEWLHCQAAFQCESFCCFTMASKSCNCFMEIYFIGRIGRK